MDTNSSRHFLGYSVEVIGDVNGDGFHDLGIGEPYVDSAGPSSLGALHVLFGSASGFGSTYNQTISGPSPGSRLGVQMAAAGDVDRDGYDDVWAIRPGVGNDGDLALLWGSSTGLISTPRLYEMGDFQMLFLYLIWTMMPKRNGSSWEMRSSYP